MDFNSLSPEQKEHVLNGPALTPPDGVVPVFDRPPNQNAMVVTLTIACMVLITIVYFLRAVPKILVPRNIVVEDLLAFAAFCHMVAFAWCMIHLAYATPGWFVHQWNFRFKDTAPFAYIIHVGSSLIAVVIMLMKAAIIIDWIRIFVPGRTRNAFFWCGWAFIALNTGFYVAGIVSENLSCTPFQSIWDKTISDGHCLNTKALDIAAASIDFVSDLAVIILPQQVIWRLQMSTQKKIGISLLFGMGLFALISSAFRTAATVVYHQSHDATYYVCPVALWAFVRLVALFLIFCVPACPKALQDLGITPAIKKSFKSITSGWSATNNHDLSASQDAGAKTPHPRCEQRNFNKDSILLTNISSQEQDISESTENLRGNQEAYHFEQKHGFRGNGQSVIYPGWQHEQPAQYGIGFVHGHPADGGILRTDTVDLESTQVPVPVNPAQYAGYGVYYQYQWNER